VGGEREEILKRKVYYRKFYARSYAQEKEGGTLGERAQKGGGVRILLPSGHTESHVGTRENEVFLLYAANSRKR